VQGVLPAPEGRGLYVWLGAGGVLLVLLLLAFAYLVLRRRWDWLSGLFRHPALRTMDAWLAGRLPRLWTFIRRRLTVHQWHGLALSIAVLVVFAALSLFAFITESWIDQDDLYALDRQAHGWLDGALGDRSIRFMRAVTHFGDGVTALVLGVALGGYLLYRRQRWRVVALALSVGVGEALLWTLKWAFGRERPGAQLTRTVGESFPSGHAFTATVLYGFLIYLTWRTVRHDAVRVPVTVAFTLLIVLVGLSRVVLSAHWVTDVLGGFTLGLGWLVCSLVLTRALRAYRSPAARLAAPE
jgi:membrane-associated phospholipid phosphatase